MENNKDIEIAKDKVMKIAAMLGVNVTTENEDGSTTTHEPVQPKNNAVSMADLVRVILE